MFQVFTMQNGLIDLPLSGYLLVHTLLEGIRTEIADIYFDIAERKNFEF